MNWSEWILHHEIVIRLSFFFGVFATMAIWEAKAPKRKPLLSRRMRWPSNIGIVLLNSLMLRLIFPAAAVGVAVLCNTHNWGIFNNLQVLGLPSLPLSFTVILCVITLDLFIYLQHIMFHAVPIFWRLHQVHHADLDYDVTTGARFHSLEILLSMLIKVSVIMLLGPPVIAVIIFEILLNATAMFNHSNVALPLNLDRFLRKLIVTPDMHRVHHSTITNEANSNFGFNLPWWDRIFGTYTAQPSLGHTEMEIGLKNIKEPHQTNQLIGMLQLPFKQLVQGYAVKDRLSVQDSDGK